MWHYLKDGTLAVEFRGKVTCVMATADYATITGEITKVVVGDPVREGQRADFSVVGNNRESRVGFGGQACW